MREPERPVRTRIEDFRCWETCEHFDYHKGCADCYECDKMNEEGETECEMAEYNGIRRRDEITLGELIRTYGGFNPDDIVIEINYDYDMDETNINITRPDGDSTFSLKVLEYEKKMEKYEKWLKDNPPEKRAEEKALKKKLSAEKKIQKIEAEKQAQIDKLKKQLEKLGAK